MELPSRGSHLSFVIPLRSRAESCHFDAASCSELRAGTVGEIKRTLKADTPARQAGKPRTCHSVCARVCVCVMWLRGCIAVLRQTRPDVGAGGRAVRTAPWLSCGKCDLYS